MRRTLAIAFAILTIAAPVLAETMPAELQAPNSAMLVGRFHAVGVQIYRCDPAGRGWVLKAPEAMLSDDEATQRIHHFAGPSWQAGDGSKIVGKVVATVPARAPDAIPWLLLETTSVGSGFLDGVRFVQRFDTRGGAAPSTACATGEEVRIPYSATYGFYR